MHLIGLFAVIYMMHQDRLAFLDAKLGHPVRSSSMTTPFTNRLGSLIHKEWI